MNIIKNIAKYIMGSIASIAALITGIAGLITGIGFIISFIYLICLYFSALNMAGGLVVIIIGVALFPITLIVLPFYSIFINADWSILGFIILTFILFGITSGLFSLCGACSNNFGDKS